MTPWVKRKRIGAVGNMPTGAYQLLFKGLATLYPVEFIDAETHWNEPFDAVVVLNGNLNAALNAAAEGTAAFVQLEGAGPELAAGDRVQFGTSDSLDPVFRSQSITIERETRFLTITPLAGDEILASVGDRAIWVSRNYDRGSCQIVGTPLPVIHKGDLLFKYFSGRNFMGLLPLLHFLRELVRGADWDSPPPRACFVFDDPSMYRQSYGFLDYQRLAQHAAEHGYYASVATIPLDTWWVNDDVAETLRRSSPRLSVLIHGNNHTNDEMLMQGQEEDYLAVAAQAIRRMERLTQKHHIPFLKVMEAPHGALANDLLPHLLALGYEGALCTPSLFVLHNEHTEWSPTFGLDRAEMLGGGLPIIPRIRMSPDWKNDVLLAAFLRQPIIVAGHHYDAADGMGLLAELADVVNRLQGVQWSDLQGILQANYRQKIEGDVLRVRLYSRHVVVAVPPGVKQLSVERPWIFEGRFEKLLITLNGSERLINGAGNTAGGIALDGAGTVEITSVTSNPVHYSKVDSPSVSLWPFARKAIMEARDRLSPVLPLVDRLRRRPDSKLQ